MAAKKRSRSKAKPRAEREPPRRARAKGGDECSDLRRAFDETMDELRDELEQLVDTLARGVGLRGPRR